MYVFIIGFVRSPPTCAHSILLARVDKYGRKLSKTHEEDNLKKYYRLASDDDNGNNDETEGVANLIDFARGEVILESSDEEGHQEGEDTEGSDQSDTEEIVKFGGSDDELEIDLDEDTYAELDAQVAAYTKVNKVIKEKEETEDIGLANRTCRLAAVNLDWDYVRAAHLYKIFSSVVSLAGISTNGNNRGSNKGNDGTSPVARGAVLSVKVYPSEFGKARMEREEKEGPPAEVFRKKLRNPEEINEKTIYKIGDESEYDENALRRYQLERLRSVFEAHKSRKIVLINLYRYYYAIVECDTTEVASHIYNELEGAELERSANVFDLSFVPEDMSFDDEPRCVQNFNL